MKREIEITDDNFVTGYGRHLDEQAACIAALHLQQFIQNFESCFGFSPAPHQLDAAFKFMKLYLQEYMDTYPGPCPYNAAISKVMHLVDSQDAVINAEKMARVGGKIYDTPTAADWFTP